MRHGFAAWVGIALLVIAGCSSAASPPDGSTPSPSLAATTGTSGGASTIPPGTYTADIPEGVEAHPGTWRMEVTENAISWTNPDGVTFSPGEVLEVTSDRIVFAADPACPDQEEPTDGAYGWEVAGNELSFTVESDSCAGRRDTLTAAAWELAP